MINSAELSLDDGVLSDLSTLNMTAHHLVSLRQRKKSFNVPLNATITADLKKMQVDLTVLIPNRKIFKIAKIRLQLKFFVNR